MKAGDLLSKSTIRFEAEERPPHSLAILLGLQVVILVVAGVVIIPAIVLKAAGAMETYGAWAIFAALMISGLVTVLQACRVGRFGAGHVLFMGTSGAFIAISITAVEQGGLPLLMTLVIVASAVQFLLAGKLAVLRRVITPAVGGLVIMLIAVTVMPIAFGFLGQLPGGESTPDYAGPVIAGATFVTVLAISIAGSRMLRLWAPILGVAVGYGVSAGMGVVETEAIAAAPWFGLPDGSWPGLDLSFGPGFWMLLPAVILVTIVSAIETYGDGIAIQRVSSRRPRAIDFKVVQGAIYADGLGNLLAGLGGTLPNTTYSTSVAVVEITGVAARRVGIYGGLFLMALAFSPKIAAALVSVPSPVAGAYVIVLLVLLFMHGVQLVGEGGIDYEKSLIVGLSFWFGVGFQNQAIFHDLLSPWARSILDNGMTAGGLCGILLTLLFALKNRSRDRMTAPLDLEALPEIQAFLQDVAARAGWDKPAADRLKLVGEESLLFLLERREGSSDPVASVKPQILRLIARTADDVVEMEFAAAPRGTNLEDRLSDLRPPDEVREDDLSLRLLQRFAHGVKHHQYTDVDLLTLRVPSEGI